MTSLRPVALAALGLLLPNLAQAAPPGEIEKGRAALDAARLAYQKAGYWLWRVRSRRRTLPVRHDSMPLTTPAE